MSATATEVPPRAVPVIAAVTMVVAVVAMLATAFTTAAGDRTFAGLSGVFQSVLSIGVPFIGAVLGAKAGPGRALPAIRTALGYAAGLALVGVLFTVLALRSLSTSAPGVWDHAVLVVVGAVVTQVVAQFVGTGFGLLTGRPVVGAALTVVAPLGLWLLLGAVAPGARPWLTPLPSATSWWAGEWTAADWPPFLVMLAGWAVALNLLGLRAHARRHRTDPTR